MQSRSQLIAVGRRPREDEKRLPSPQTELANSFYLYPIAFRWQAGGKEENADELI
jgi:hypothetical protein